MASNTLPLNIEMAALPDAVRWVPQQLGDAIAARLRITTQQNFALFVSGSTEPASNVGPWFKNGNTWYYFDVNTGSYKPQILAQESLGYIISATAPSPTQYKVWIETTALGSPLAIKTYYSGAWVDVYAATLTSYQTVAAMSAYYTAAQTDAAIASALGATNSYIAKATNSAPQTLTANGAPQKAVLDTAVVNPSPSPFNTSTYRYTAPAAGNYQINAYAQVDNDTAASATMEVLIDIYINGSSATQSGDSTPSPNGARWWPAVNDVFPLAQNDYVEIFVSPNDGVGSGNVELTDINFSAYKIAG